MKIVKTGVTIVAYLIDALIGKAAVQGGFEYMRQPNETQKVSQALEALPLPHRLDEITVLDRINVMGKQVVMHYEAELPMLPTSKRLTWPKQGAGSSRLTRKGSAPRRSGRSYARA